MKIHTLKCDCGWWFLSLNQWTNKCPQCRDVEKIHCLCCSVEIFENKYCKECLNNGIGICIACGNEKENPAAKFCDACRIQTRRISKKYQMQKWRAKKNFKDSEIRICDYDCFNCKFSECIQPVDADGVQNELF